MADALEQLKERLGRLTDLERISRLLGWDQQTMMPPRGAAGRAEEMATLGRVIHERFTAPEIGRLLYILARGRNAKTIVEFGTSYGISGIHLASALRDGGGGRLITTEFDAIKADGARANFRSAGLDDLIEIRVGDAFDTLKADVGGPIGFGKLLVMKVDAGHLSEPLDRLDEVEVLKLLHETDDVAALAATKTMEEILRRI